MKKIYLTGYYGQNNLGDDYIFYSILDQLGDLKQEVELNVEIGNLNFDESVYNELVSKYRNVTIKYTYIDGLRGKINKVFSLVKASNWIVGGGGLFPTEDVAGLKHLNVYLRLASIFGTKICMYGIDIDSLRKPEYIEQWKKATSFVDFIVARNSYCAESLRGISHKAEKIIPGVDLTHGFYTEEERTFKRENLLMRHNLDEKYMMWAVAMPWNKNELQNPEIKKRYDRLCSQFRHLLLGLKDLQHVFLPYFSGTDIDMINDIVCNTDIHYQIIDCNCALGEKRLLFKYAEKAVVMRFHGVQFALFHGTPFIAISYSPKTTNILDELGLQNQYVEYGIRKESCFMREFDISDTDWEVIEQKCGYQRERIGAVSKELKKKANKQKDFLLQWLK